MLRTDEVVHGLGAGLGPVARPVVAQVQLSERGVMAQTCTTTTTTTDQNH
jgi:hypothetical protein